MQNLRQLTGAGQVAGLLPCQDCDQLRRTRKEVRGAKKLLGTVVWNAVRLFSSKAP
jgi:hypothetical protein